MSGAYDTGMRLDSTVGHLLLNVELREDGFVLPTGMGSRSKGTFKADRLQVIVSVEGIRWVVSAADFAGPMFLVDGVELAAKKRGSSLFSYPLDGDELVPDEVVRAVRMALASWLPGGQLVQSSA